MLIRGAELENGAVSDLRIEHGIVAHRPADPFQTEPVMDACGGLVLPGLHDHHIHVAALAASLTSVRCGPPDVAEAERVRGLLAATGQWLAQSDGLSRECRRHA